MTTAQSMTHRLLPLALIALVAIGGWNSHCSRKLAQRNSPILVLGLPRSGAKAIHDFFTCSQIRSSHYCCDGGESFPCSSMTCGSCLLENWQHDRPAFDGCGDVQVFAQFDVESQDPYQWFLPQHFALPLLHRDMPGAVWILNRRANAEAWATSVLHWYSVSNRILNSFGVPYHAKYPNGTLFTPSHEMTMTGLEKDLAQSIRRTQNTREHKRRLQALVLTYNRHLKKVREAARAFGHHLIEVDVDEASAGSVLATAIPGLSSECWKFDATTLDDDWKRFDFHL